METTKNAKVEAVDMKLEVAVLGVSDVDRAKVFYENLGWRLDADIARDDFRGVQVTPHNSQASIIFGKGVTSAKPGSAGNLVLAVDDLDAARDDLIARGVEVRFSTTLAAPSTTPLTTLASPDVTRKVVPTTRLPRSRILTEWLAAPGDHDAASRPRVEVDAAVRHRRGKPCRTLARDSGAPRPLRENAPRAQLVGLVRALPQRARERQQSGGGSSRRRPLHGGGPSCPPMTS
jgi:catechol 2,3-dioxygenase-like lactoylglutathione lyase family enzyme